MYAHLTRPDAARGGIGFAFTDRHGGVTRGLRGSLNLGRTDVDEVAHVRENIRRVTTDLGVDRVIMLHQVHGTEVLVADDARVDAWGPDDHLGSVGGHPALPTADAVVTTVAGVAIAVRVADCLPVLLADHEAGVIGAAHAGRPGLYAGVLPRTVEAMTRLGATRITALVGPHVCGDCYEVPQELVDELAPALPRSRATTSWGTPALDLAAGAVDQLTDLGCRVDVVGGCTRADPALHSHRRDGTDSGRLAGLVWRVAGVGAGPTPSPDGRVDPNRSDGQERAPWPND